MVVCNPDWVGGVSFCGVFNRYHANVTRSPPLPSQVSVSVRHWSPVSLLCHSSSKQYDSMKLLCVCVCVVTN
jgi:hypothetical protein